MIQKQTVSIKKICLWCLMVICWVMAACLAFVSFLSICAGIGHTQQPGFWVPIVFGALLLIAVLMLFVYTTMSILSHIKEEDVLSP